MSIENPNLKVLLFYSVSLVLSLITVVVSTTVFIVVIYLNGSVPASFLYVFAAVMVINIATLSVSLRKILVIYPLILPGEPNARIVVANFNSPLQSQHIISQSERNFSQVEIEIIELLKRNRKRMLQNMITSSMPMSKATVSRTLTSLENKGAVVRLRKGMTNEVILSETIAD